MQGRDMSRLPRQGRRQMKGSCIPYAVCLGRQPSATPLPSALARQPRHASASLPACLGIRHTGYGRDARGRGGGGIRQPPFARDTAASLARDTAISLSLSFLSFKNGRVGNGRCHKYNMHLIKNIIVLPYA